MTANAYETVTTGKAYNPGADVADIARALRAEFKAEFDESIKFSVSIKRFSMGCSLTVEIKSAPYPVMAAPGTLNGWGQQERYTEAGAKLLALVERRVNAYRQARSDYGGDYYNTNFYGHVQYARGIV